MTISISDPWACLQMMQNMLLQVGDMVKFRNVSLPKGKYVKLQPVSCTQRGGFGPTAARLTQCLP
jgi:hypothetical protein